MSGGYVGEGGATHGGLGRWRGRQLGVVGGVGAGLAWIWMRPRAAPVPTDSGGHHIRRGCAAGKRGGARCRGGAPVAVARPVAGQFRASFERTRHRMRCACGRKGKASRAGVRGELRP
nr:hypothetical protein RVX_2650 [Nitratidesulfovibrio sp. HK-II]